MRVEFDQAKRDVTLAERGLDFADAVSVFEGRSITFEDERRVYGESRIITIGEMGQRMVVIAWTPRGDARRVISMRRANDREQALYALG